MAYPTAIALSVAVALLAYYLSWNWLISKANLQPCASQWAATHSRLSSVLQSTNDEWVELNAWLSSVGATQNAEPGIFGQLRGLKANTQIPKGGLVVDVPMAAALSAVSFTARSDLARVIESWRDIQDADLFLEVLALLYEIMVNGVRSPWRMYILSMPLEYQLPINYTDRWCIDAVAQLPAMEELQDERHGLLATMFPETIAALRQLPGGAASLKRWSTCEQWHLFVFAYAATKTRTVNIIPSGQWEEFVPDWIDEIGVMVPLLDLANHATNEAEVNVEMQWDAAGVRLVATRDIAEGEQIQFSYKPDDMTDPNCNFRWLMEYGFPIPDNHPQRDCFWWTLTPQELTAVIARSTAPSSPITKHANSACVPLADGEGGAPSAAYLLEVEVAVRERLVAAGLALEQAVEVDRRGVMDLEVLHWVGVAIGQPAHAVMMLKECLAQHANRVRLIRDARINQQHDRDICHAHMHGVLEGSLRAIDAAIKSV